MNNMDNSAVLMTDNEFSISHLLVFHAHNLFRIKLQFPVLPSSCEAIYTLTQQKNYFAASNYKVIFQRF